LSTVLDETKTSIEVAPESMALSKSSLSRRTGLEMTSDEPRRRTVPSGRRYIGMLNLGRCVKILKEMQRGDVEGRIREISYNHLGKQE
jgi:hypothetical protein